VVGLAFEKKFLYGFFFRIAGVIALEIGRGVSFKRACAGCKDMSCFKIHSKETKEKPLPGHTGRGDVMV
jgi:hypothetical protein